MCSRKKPLRAAIKSCGWRLSVDALVDSRGDRGWQKKQPIGTTVGKDWCCDQLQKRDLQEVSKGHSKLFLSGFEEWNHLVTQDKMGNHPIYVQQRLQYSKARQAIDESFGRGFKPWKIRVVSFFMDSAVLDIGFAIDARVVDVMQVIQIVSLSWMTDIAWTLADHGSVWNMWRSLSEIVLWLSRYDSYPPWCVYQCSGEELPVDRKPQILKWLCVIVWQWNNIPDIDSPAAYCTCIDAYLSGLHVFYRLGLSLYSSSDSENGSGRLGAIGFLSMSTQRKSCVHIIGIEGPIAGRKS